MRPRIFLPALSTVDHEFKDAKADSEYQVCWSNTMNKGCYKNPSSYQKVEVLLLCWADNSDDLATKEEVNKLRSVFSQDFHYHTHTEYLDVMIEKRLQVQVNAKVAAFVHAHDGPDTLLIVYYAGHGRPGSYYGALEMHGQSSPNDKRDEKKKQIDKIVWNKAEDLLRPAEADILVIFDCCHAATIGLTRGDKRFFEYLGATEAMGGTPVPGNESFTSALIFALQYLVENQAEGRFTTFDLLNTITSRAPDFPKDQTPVLYNRKDGGRSGQIMLHPISSHGSNAQIAPAEDSPSELAKRQTVTLHFDFDDKPPLEHIEKLGLELNDVFDRSALKVNGIRWGGLKPSLFPRVVQTLLKGHHRRASMKREQESMNTDDSEDWSVQCSPEPITPSSPSQHSPRIHRIVIKRDVVIDPTRLSPLFSPERDDDFGRNAQGRQKKRKIAYSGQSIA